jgi:hypothetical protein
MISNIMEFILGWDWRQKIGAFLLGFSLGMIITAIGMSL